MKPVQFQIKHSMLSKQHFSHRRAIYPQNQSPTATRSKQLVTSSCLKVNDLQRHVKISPKLDDTRGMSWLSFVLFGLPLLWLMQLCPPSNRHVTTINFFLRRYVNVLIFLLCHVPYSPTMRMYMSE